MNFFLVDNKYYLIDNPGYGFTKINNNFQEMMNSLAIAEIFFLNFMNLKNKYLKISNLKKNSKFFNKFEKYSKNKYKFEKFFKKYVNLKKK